MSPHPHHSSSDRREATSVPRRGSLVLTWTLGIRVSAPLCRGGGGPGRHLSPRVAQVVGVEPGFHPPISQQESEVPGPGSSTDGRRSAAPGVSGPLLASVPGRADSGGGRGSVFSVGSLVGGLRQALPHPALKVPALHDAGPLMAEALFWPWPHLRWAWWLREAGCSALQHPRALRLSPAWDSARQPRSGVGME